MPASTANHTPKLQNNATTNTKTPLYDFLVTYIVNPLLASERKSICMPITVYTRTIPSLPFLLNEFSAVRCKICKQIFGLEYIVQHKISLA
jgi:hypothetical protein